MNIEDILNHSKIEKSKQIVSDINDDMIGRVALNQGAQATHILYIIKELLGDKCKRVLDSGTLWGGSVITMMQSEYKSHFVSIDFFNGYYKELTSFDEDPVCGGTNTIATVSANIERHNKYNHSYDLMEGSSYDLSVIENVHSLLDNSIDLLFIDGDHRKAGVIKDFDAYSELVTVGGIVVFDDYWTGDLAKYAWKNKSHWDEPERMDIVGAYAELESRDDFYKKWKSIGLIADKKIIQKKA